MKKNSAKKQEDEIRADIKEVRHAIRTMHRMGLRFVSGSIHQGPHPDRDLREEQPDSNEEAVS